MNGIDMYQSLELIDDQHIEEALRAKPVRRHKVRRAVLKAVAIAAALLLAFVGTVNLFPVTAYALSSIPVLGDIARAVTFDPSMKECLSHDYAQYVGESQTVDGYHSEVCFMVVDPSRISVFFTADVPPYCPYDGAAYLTVDCFTDIEGNDIECSWAVSQTGTENLYESRMDMVDGAPIPDAFYFRIQYFTSAGFSDVVACAEYTLYPDKKYSAVVDSYEINRTVEIMGQTILIDRLDVYPTQAKLYFSMDDANTALLTDITLMLVDEQGRAYPQRSNGALGTVSDNGRRRSEWFESPYFSEAESLTLQITGVSFQDEDVRYGTVDYSNQTIGNMPEGISVASMILDDEGSLEIALRVPERRINFPIAESVYRDMQGNEYASSYDNGLSSVYWYGYEDEERWPEDIWLEEEGYMYQVISIADYRDNTYQIEWLYAPETVLETPIVISVFG